MPQHIWVTNYSEDWKFMFEEEAKKIRCILQENCVELYHIGSTSVPELKAKPIIDIMPVVKDLQKVDAVSVEFEKLGYEYLGEFGIVGRRYLRKGGDERTHQIHIFETGNHHDIERHLAVRDYLRTHKDVADEYGQLKEKLAAAYPYDIEKYGDGKEAFVRKLEKNALLWKKNFCIRKYVPEDFERLCQIHDPARKKELALAGLSAAFVPLSLAAEREGLFEYQVYVAEYEGTLAGFVAFSSEELAWLYVNPTLSRHGIGSRLVEFALKQMEAEAAIEVLVGNEPALALYSKFGFAISSTETGNMPGNEDFSVIAHVLKREIRKKKK